MSDEEEVVHSYDDENTLGTISEEEEEDTNSEDESEDEKPKNEPAQEEEEEEEERPSGPSEAELAAQSRPNQFLNCGIDDETLALLELARKEREQQAEEIRVLKLKRKRKAMDKIKSVKGLDEHDKEMLAANQVERDIMAKEIAEMKKRSELRKKEREEEEKRLQKERAAEDSRRKAEEEERKKKKEEEEHTRKAERAQKMAEFEKWKNPQTPNFVITKKSSSGPKEEEEEKASKRRARLAKAGSKIEIKEEESGSAVEKKSREQLEAEKKAILAQRIQPLNIDGADMSKLTEKAKELQSFVMRLESEKYDLEKRFKNQQIDMMELAEKARQMNKIGRGGQIKRLQLEDDQMQQKFAGCPSKIVMYSEYERQKDPRGYVDRKGLFKGPVYGFPADKISPTRVIKWNDQTGLPEYEELSGAEAQAATAGGEEE